MTETARDLIFAVIALALGLAVTVMALGYPIGSSYFPLTLAVLMMLLAAGYGLRLWLAHAPAKPAGGPSWRAAGAAFGATVGYALVMMVVGYEVSTFLFLTLLIGALGGGHWLRAGLVALGTTAALWLVFFWLLQIPQPDSLFL